jgi:hypothetical protein
MIMRHTNIEAKETRPQPLEVMVVYDDIGAAKRAKELCDRVSQRLGPGFKLNLSVWRLSMLRFPEISRVATEAAQRVVAIIFTAKGHTDLLPQAKAWIEKVTRQKRRSADCVLVALLHHIPRFAIELAPAWISLHCFARNGGMEFLSGTIEPREDEGDYSIEAIQQRAFNHTALLDAILQHQ